MKIIFKTLLITGLLLPNWTSAQSSCANPTVVSCGTTLTNESTIGQGNNMDYDGTCVSLTANNGEDVVYAITPNAGVSEITVTMDNVNITTGFPTENYFEVYIATQANCATSCFQHTQFTENGTVNGGTSNTAIFSLGLAANGTDTWYITIDEQLTGGNLQSYDITFDCISGGVHLDTDGCPGDAGASSSDGHNETWNGSYSNATLINGCGDAGTFCTEFWMENPGWEWVDQIEMVLGPCWDGNSISNPTPSSGWWYEVGGDWSVSVNNATSTILWDFTSSGGFGAWGDGNSNNQNCLNYTFCFDATILPNCTDENDLNFTITVTDDGIGGSGATVASFFNYSTNFSLIPPPTITGNVPMCVGDNITLVGSGTPNAVTPWASSNPGIISVDNAGNLTANSAGVVTITYTDDAGCQVDATVGANPSPTVSGNNSACVGATVQLSGTGTPDPGTPWSTSNSAVATVDNTGLVSGVSSGTADITFTNDDGCQDMVTITITAGPVIAAVPTDPAICNALDGSIEVTLTSGATSNGTLDWTGTTNGSSPGTDITVVSPDLSGLGAGNYDITFTDANGCVSNTEMVALINPGAPIIDPFNPIVACDSAQLPSITGTNLTPALSWWDGSGATGNQLNAGDWITTNGTYFAYDSTAAASPCWDEQTIAFTIDITGDPSFSHLDHCAGGANVAMVTGTSGGTFDFNPQPGDGASVDPSTGAISNGVGGTTYIVEYNTGGACPAISTQNVQVFAIPPAPIVTGGGTYCENEDIPDLVASSTGGTITWASDSLFANILGAGNSWTISGLAGTTTTYYVYESANGCDGPYSSTSVTIEACGIIIPTAITPDNDMMNDDWEIVNLDNAYPDNNVFIYNRWGNIIFEHFSATDGTYDANRWDGTFNGEMLPVGSYYFIIEFNNEADESATGTVSIILQD